MRPTFTTGQAAPKVSTTAICSSTRNMSRMLLGWNSAKLSAQSPPCSRKALPAATAASRSSSRRASPAKTSGGKLRRVASTARQRAPRRDSPAPAGSAGRASSRGTIFRSCHDTSWQSRRVLAGVRGWVWSCITSGLEAAPPSATFGSARGMKCESRLGCGRLRGKRGCAILGRRHVPAVPKSRNVAGPDRGRRAYHRKRA